MQLRDAGQARPRRPARAAPRRRRERLADDPAAALPPLGPAARGGGDVRDAASRRPRSSWSTRWRASSSCSRPAQQHHYSNLAFALLGQVVARKSGQPYTDYVDERIIGPLGLERTTWRPQAPKAQGYLVDEYARTVWREPETDLGGAAAGGPALVDGRGSRAAGRRSSRPGDDGVLAPAVVEEMWFPQVMYYPRRLGARLGARADAAQPATARIFGGHGGAMAGHLAGVFVDRKTKIGAAALTNSGTRGDMELFAIALAAKDARALAARRSSRGSPRRSRRRTCGRCSAAGGRRATSSSSGGRTARCTRRSSGRRRVAARRRSSATATAGAPPGPRARRAAARRRRPARLGRLRVHARTGAVQGVGSTLDEPVRDDARAP